MQLPAWLWIFLIGALVAISCSLVGSFLVLRRMAMLGDAISHAVLPGIALAFLFTGSRSSWIMLFGAAILGVVTAFLVQLLSRGGVRNDAAIGVTFTSLFAFGVILISKYASKVDLDTDCVLYGVIEYAPLNTLTLYGRDWGPVAFWQMLTVTALCLAFVVVLWKELKFVTFDPATAAAMGLSTTAVHYALMGMVSLATVGAFEPVGAILVVAMLVVPPATAYLLTDDLKTMVILACGLGTLAALGGALGAERFNLSTSGLITVMSGFFFILALVLSPRQGVLFKKIAQLRLGREVAREDVLQALFRAREKDAPPPGTAELAHVLHLSEAGALRTLHRLARASLVEAHNGTFMLTPAGSECARDLVHRHRVYESYLSESGYAADHLHEATDRVEHFLSPQLERDIDEAVGNPTQDPHGRNIPHP